MSTNCKNRFDFQLFLYSEASKYLHNQTEKNAEKMLTTSKTKKKQKKNIYTQFGVKQYKLVFQRK